MHKTKIIAALSFGATALSLAACSLPPAPPPRGSSSIGATGLEGSSWVLESLGGQAPLESTVVTLNFEANRVNGTDGCNRFTAGYSLDGFNIALGPLAGTLMACPEPIMNQAAQFQAALANARSFRVADGRLTLLDADGNSLATLVVQNTDVVGTSWRVTGYNDGRQAVVSVLSGTQLTVVFGDDGRVSGSAGCNNFTGGYTVEGNAIKIGPLAATRKLCPSPEGVMEQEVQFLAALESAATYRIDGNRMDLRTAGDAIAVSLMRAE